MTGLCYLKHNTFKNTTAKYDKKSNLTKPKTENSKESNYTPRMSFKYTIINYLNNGERERDKQGEPRI